jgi:2-oxoglutarate ferredoxin oxidoreductase subunit delta
VGLQGGYSPKPGIDAGNDMAKKKKLKRHIINREWCKGCGICISVCPKSVLELDKKDKAVAVRKEDCIACQLCEQICPDLAIEVLVKFVEESSSEDSKDAQK